MGTAWANDNIRLWAEEEFAQSSQGQTLHADPPIEVLNYKDERSYKEATYQESFHFLFQVSPLSSSLCPNYWILPLFESRFNFLYTLFFSFFFWRSFFRSVPSHLYWGLHLSPWRNQAVFHCWSMLMASKSPSKSLLILGRGLALLTKFGLD